MRFVPRYVNRTKRRHIVKCPCSNSRVLVQTCLVYLYNFVLRSPQTRNDDEPVSSRGGQRHGGMSPMREPSSDYCEPLDSVLRHARASQNSSGGRSPVHPRSPSSERAPSERSPVSTYCKPGNVRTGVFQLFCL